MVPKAPRELGARLSRCGWNLCACVALVVVAGPVLEGCKSLGHGSGGRSPKEVLDYKLKIVEENSGELTSEQQQAIVMNPLFRTYEEVDEALEKARTEFKARDDARARAEAQGIEIGSRRRVSRRVWVRGADGVQFLERVPFDPLDQPQNTATTNPN